MTGYRVRLAACKRGVFKVAVCKGYGRHRLATVDVADIKPS